MSDENVTYEGLTAKEKAKQAVAQMGVTGQIMKVAWAMEIEKALNAQIEDCARLVELPTLIGLDDLAKAIRARKSKGD